MQQLESVAASPRDRAAIESSTPEMKLEEHSSRGSSPPRGSEGSSRNQHQIGSPRKPYKLESGDEPSIFRLHSVEKNPFRSPDEANEQHDCEPSEEEIEEVSNDLAR